MGELSVGVCVPKSLVRAQLECSITHHWTLHSAFAVVERAHRGMLQLRQELNQGLESWSCDPSSHPCIMDPSPFLCSFPSSPIYWLLLLSSSVSSHYAEPDKWRIFIPCGSIQSNSEQRHVHWSSMSVVPLWSRQTHSVLSAAVLPEVDSLALLPQAWGANLPCSGGLDTQEAQHAHRTLSLPISPNLFLSPTSWLSGWHIKLFCSAGSPCIKKVVTFLIKKTQNKHLKACCKFRSSCILTKYRNIQDHSAFTDA